MDGPYTLQAPTKWTSGPERWSNTTLNGVDECPRRWQLARSAWGEFPRYPERYHPAAIEGIIVHDGIDLLSRACGRLGRPSLGTGRFRQALDESRFFTSFATAIDEWNERLRRHPRHGPLFSLRTSPQELANRAVRLFREQYQAADGEPAERAERGRASGVTDPQLQVQLESRGLLSEVELHHPTLSFTGKIDRVQLSEEGVDVVDFKTGAPKPGHQTQLERYAVLWWRNAGVVPARATAQYLNTSVSWPLTEADLERAEAELEREINLAEKALRQRPAAGKPGAPCRFCPVRARCAEGWAHVDAGKSKDGTVDIELELITDPGPSGFLANSRGGQDVSVVHVAALRERLPPLAAGAVVRVVAARGTEKDKMVELKPWTEVFHVASASSGGSFPPLVSETGAA